VPAKSKPASQIGLPLSPRVGLQDRWLEQLNPSAMQVH